MIIPLIAAIFVVVGMVLLFNFTPEQMTEDVLKITTSKVDVRKKVTMLRSGKDNRSIGQKLAYVKNSMDAMGKGNKFGIVISATLLLFGGGAVIAVVMNNLFLIPAFGVGFAMIPFVYVRSSLQAYKRHINEELETTLSIITTSYLRSEDIISAVRENIDYIKPPLKEHFQAFLNDASFVTSTEQAIINLKNKVDNNIYEDWCDALLQCQSDRVLKDTLQPIVTRLTDVRIVNSEIAVMLSSVRAEYFTMVAMVVGSIPLLKIVNTEWFDTLMFTIPGKITLGVVGVVLVLTFLRFLKHTEPIEYKA